MPFRFFTCKFPFSIAGRKTCRKQRDWGLDFYLKKWTRNTHWIANHWCIGSSGMVVVVSSLCQLKGTTTTEIILNWTLKLVAFIISFSYIIKLCCPVIRTKQSLVFFYHLDTEVKCNETGSIWKVSMIMFFTIHTFYPICFDDSGKQSSKVIGCTEGYL